MTNKLIVIDNYDSFTYNLVHYLEAILQTEVAVKRNDEVTLDEIENYNHIVLSPGPGLPVESGLLLPIINRYAPNKRILGVCLGLQAIAESFGGTLLNLPKVYHGIATTMYQTTANEPIFRDIPTSFPAGRYHSWVADRTTLPECLHITALDSEGQIMALRHSQYDICAVQFHPESIMTPNGYQMLQNWLIHSKISPHLS